MLRLVWRAVFFAAYTAKITGEIYLKGRLYSQFGVREAMPIRRRWAKRLLHGVGLRITKIGEAPDFPCIVVCNHRSYLDPIILLCDIDGYPVSKAEIENWPILGYGAKLAGILYLKREETASRIATLKAILGTVQKGFPVILFPEGTTSDLEGMLELKKGAFQIAAKFDIPIVPAAIVYKDRADHWVGSESFGSHSGRRFREKNIAVSIQYGAAIRSNNADELLEKSKHWIESQLKYQF